MTRDSGPFLQNVNGFIDQLRQKPLWIFGWAIFVASILFLKEAYLDSPTRIGRVESDIARFRTYIEDYYQVIRVRDIVKESYDSYNQVIYELNDLTNQLDQHPDIPFETFNAAKARAQAAQSLLAQDAGTLAGLTFNNSTLNPHIHAFSLNLSRRQQFLEKVIEFYSAVNTPDADRIYAAMIAIGQSDLDLHSAEAEMQESMSSFNRDFANYRNNMAVDVNTETQAVQTFQVMDYLAWIAVIYLSVFIVVAIVAWVRGSRRVTATAGRRHVRRRNVRHR